MLMSLWLVCCTKATHDLAVNKVDNQMRTDIYEFYGSSDPYPISGSHGLGIGDVLDEAVKHFTNEAEEEDDSIIKFSLIGRPNVGKSSLINAILGEERVIVSDRKERLVMRSIPILPAKAVKNYHD